MTSAAATKLLEALERARVHHERRAHDSLLAGRLDALAQWQAARLTQTYTDLAAVPRYADAIVFFRSDLYGPGDFSRRDADLARVVPILSRTLPEGVITTVAKAMELSALSHELDRAMIDNLDTDCAIDGASYALAYRRCGRAEDRALQIELIGEVGRSLERYVHKPLVSKALVLMRKPARAAGFGELQDFLERGFRAFASIGDAAEFLAIIEQRETALMHALFVGENAPEVTVEAPRRR